MGAGKRQLGNGAQPLSFADKAVYVAGPPLDSPQAMNSEQEIGAVQWHWATEFVQPQQGSQDDLLIKLASGELPPFVLVWRAGWAHWLPAMQVAELSHVLPVGVVGTLYDAVPTERSATRPHVPISEFPRLRQLARESLRAGTSRVRTLADLESEPDVPSWATRESNFPEQDLITLKVPEVELKQAALAMQQLVPPDQLQLSSGLDVGSNVPLSPGLSEAASNDADIPDSGIVAADSEATDSERLASWIPGQNIPEPELRELLTLGGPVGGGDDEAAADPSPMFPVQLSPQRQLSSVAWSGQGTFADSERGLRSSALLPNRTLPSASLGASGSSSGIAIPESSRVSTPVSASGGLFSIFRAHPVRTGMYIAALLGLGLFVAVRPRGDTAGPVSADSSAGTSITRIASLGDTNRGIGDKAGDKAGDATEDDLDVGGGSDSESTDVKAAAVLSPVCRPLGEPVQLDKWALPDIPPSIMRVPNTSQVAIGYAKSREQARGLLLDVGTLQFERVFSEGNKRNIYSVTPLAGTPSPTFRVERSSARMAYSKAIETLPPMRLGMNDASIVLGPFEGRPDSVWPIPRGAFTSLPSVAATSNGLAIATRVRSDRENASIHSGLLDRVGQAQTSLVRLDIPEGELSRPVIVVGQKNTALAVVSRGSAASGSAGRDKLYVAKAPNGQLPTEAVRIDIFGKKVRLRSPVLAALPNDGGYALGWTEGKGWRKKVRVLKLSNDLKPVGPPADITPADPDSNGALTGSLYWLPPDKPVAGDGQHLLLFHFLGREKAHSLWVSDIACEPAQVGI